MRRPRKIRRVNQQRHQVPREGAGAGTANRHQGSAFRNVPKPSGAGARTPPKGHLLRKPSWIAPPLPGHLCCTSVSSPTAHTGLQSPFIPSVPTCGEPRAHAQCALGESTGSPRKEKSHLADTPELPGTVSHSAGPWTWWRLRLHSLNRAISLARPCCHSWVTTNLRGPPVTRASGEPRLPSLPPTVSRARLQNGVETHM